MNEQSKNEKIESLNLKKQENLVKQKKLSDKHKNIKVILYYVLIAYCK